MSDSKTVKLSFRLDAAVAAALDALASERGYETTSYVQKVLTEHAIASGRLDALQSERLHKNEKVIEHAVKLARDLYDAGHFDEHFTLTVFRHGMKDKTFRSDYEAAVGGHAYELGLPGKTPLNMYLGWYIKNAVGADPKLDGDGKPLRTQVRNEPIQSYTLLRKGQS